MAYGVCLLSTFKYNHAASDFATGALNWLTCSPNLMLVDAGYVPNPTHQYVSSIPGTAIAVRDLALTSVAQTNGICAGNCPTANALAWPNQIVGIILYEKTGSDATSRLIYYSSDGAGFPFSPNGFNWAVAFDQSNTGWFQV